MPTFHASAMLNAPPAVFATGARTYLPPMDARLPHGPTALSPISHSDGQAA